MKSSISRRQALAGLATGTAGAGLSLPATAIAGQPTAAPSAASQPPGVCILFPQAVEGPYYFDPQLIRQDITEGRPGLPLALNLRIIENGPCTAISNARVDIWHADAGGVYSGYRGQGDARDVSTKGEKYLRGTQLTNGSGDVTFRSVYPGWYPGRTPHVHIKVFLDEKTMLTGQIYFPDELSRRIYLTRVPYSARPKADTTNATDFIFKSGEREGGGIVFAIEEKDDLITAGMVIAIDRSGETAMQSTGWRSMWRRMFGRE
jgi:protocatechuate 3,4-dioxygenase beta subunit